DCESSKTFGVPRSLVITRERAAGAGPLIWYAKASSVGCAVRTGALDTVRMTCTWIGVPEPEGVMSTVPWYTPAVKTPGSTVTETVDGVVPVPDAKSHAAPGATEIVKSCATPELVTINDWGPGLGPRISNV